MPQKNVWTIIKESLRKPEDVELFKKAWLATHEEPGPSMAKDQLTHHENYSRFSKLFSKKV